MKYVIALALAIALVGCNSNPTTERQTMVGVTYALAGTSHEATEYAAQGLRAYGANPVKAGQKPDLVLVSSFARTALGYKCFCVMVKAGDNTVACFTAGLFAASQMRDFAEKFAADYQSAVSLAKESISKN